MIICFFIISFVGNNMQKRYVRILKLYVRITFLYEPNTNKGNILLLLLFKKIDYYIIEEEEEGS